MPGADVNSRLPKAFPDKDLRADAHLAGAIPYLWDRERGLAWIDSATLDLDLDVLDQAVRAAVARDPSALTFDTGPEALFEIARRRPALLIFTTGQAGSSLLTRLLARPSSLTCLREPGVINQLLLDPEMRRPDLLAGAFSALGGAARASRYLIKLSSWNLLYAQTLAAAAPETPIVLLRRDPRAILASYRRQPPAWASALGDDGLCAAVAAIATAADALERSGAATFHHEAIPEAAALLAAHLGLAPLAPESERDILARHAGHPDMALAARSRA